MKARIRPISNLYHRWGERLNVDAEDVANALQAVGLIKRIGSDKYQEIERVKVPRDEYNQLVERAIKAYRGPEHG